MTFLDYLAALLLSELPADYDPETDPCEPSPAPSAATSGSRAGGILALIEGQA